MGIVAAMFCFAQVSDLHLPPLPPVPLRALASKRALGYLSWYRKRKGIHRAEVLEALVADLTELHHDHVVVTGDVTNLSLPAEYRAAAQWLHGLAPADRVSVVPGNHDAYTPVPDPGFIGDWAAFMTCDSGAQAGTFPFVRKRGPVAFIGVSSAVPSPPFMATGRIGEMQLKRLESMLDALRGSGLLRIVLLHHPPQAGAVSARRRLTDAGQFRSVLSRAGAELVLHGHAHRALVGELPGPLGPIRVLGAASATASAHAGQQSAQYHAIRVRETKETWRISAESRCYDAAKGHFIGGPVSDMDITKRVAT